MLKDMVLIREAFVIDYNNRNNKSVDILVDKQLLSTVGVALVGLYKSILLSYPKKNEEILLTLNKSLLLISDNDTENLAIKGMLYIMKIRFSRKFKVIRYTKIIRGYVKALKKTGVAKEEILILEMHLEFYTLKFLRTSNYNIRESIFELFRYVDDRNENCLWVIDFAYVFTYVYYLSENNEELAKEYALEGISKYGVPFFPNTIKSKP